MKIKSTYLILAFFSTILIFGFIYSNIPNIFNDGSNSLGRALYFSTLTITTLGNGDINQSSNLGMALVAFESVLGLMFVVLFICATWSHYISNMDRAQTKQIKRQLATLEHRKLKMFSRYLILVLNEYRVAYKFFMMPLSLISRNSILQVDFKFSDLKYLLENASNQAVVDIFYEKQDVCNENLKNLLSNSQTFNNQRLYSAILSFLHLSLVNDPRNTKFSTNILAVSNIQEEDKTELDRTVSTKPIKVFYKTLKIQYKYLKIIQHELIKMNN